MSRKAATSCLLRRIRYTFALTVDRTMAMDLHIVLLYLKLHIVLQYLTAIQYHSARATTALDIVTFKELMASSSSLHSSVHQESGASTFG